MRSQDEHYPQLYWTWQRKQKRELPNGAAISWTMKLELHIDFVQLLISRAHEVDLWKKKKESGLSSLSAQLH